MLYKTNSIDLNVPSKVMPCIVTGSVSTEMWYFDDGKGDPWWAGGMAPKPYKWRITLEVAPVIHGSHLTRIPKTFNGIDIVVGDFIAGATDGKVLQIVEIESKTETDVTCIVEDVIRYNTFRSPTGFGIFTTPGPAVLFQLNEEGDPMIDPLPTGIVSADFYANVSSRFKYLNPQRNFVLFQENNGFKEGDVIAMNAVTGDFELSTNTNIERLVGTVSHSGPGPHRFILRPMNGILDVVPGLPGSPGKFIFPINDGSGGLTTSDTGTPIYLQITDSVPTSILGSVVNGYTPANNSMEINGHTVVFAMGQVGNVANVNAASDINMSTPIHGVTAYASLSPTIITSDIGSFGSAYGTVGGYPPFTAAINGVTINFTTMTDGLASYSLPIATASDIAIDINNAGIANISAHEDAGLLVIEERLGGPVTLTNITNDLNNNPFVGTNSVISMGTSYTGQAGNQVLELRRDDGGEIIIKDITGTPSFDFGVVSGHNGFYALGLNIERGIRKAGTIVVADITARDTLAPTMVGDQAYVLDTGQGEWGMYVYDGSMWIMVASLDSAASDANSITHTFTMPLSGTTDETAILGRVSNNSKIISVVAEVIAPLSGYLGSPPELIVGTVAEPELFMDTYENDLEEVGSYVTNPDFHYAGVTELEIQAKLSYFVATAGQVKITVTYA